MAVRLTFIIIFLAVLCLVTGGAIVLQVYLSKKENRWLGLIMPGIFLCLSLVMIFSMIIYNTVLGSSDQRIVSIDPGIMSQIVISGIFTLFIMNIPTFILLAVYFGCRQKKKKNKEIEKMNIQDLE